MLDVQYEDVVADQPGQARRLLEFCGLPFEDACLRFWETRARDPHRELRAGAAADLRDSVGAWRNYERELAPLIEILRPALPAFGRNA